MELTKTKFIKTEVGLIPEDWEVKTLENLLEFGSGQDYKHLSKGEIPVYGTGGVMTYVNKYLHNGKSVGIGRKGTIDKPVFLSGKFWTVDTLFYTHNFKNTTPEFIYYKFLLIKWKDYNEASGVPSLNKNTLGKIQIANPPLPEQKAIAQVLSDTDSLIQTIEEKLLKKKAIKQGAMQKLLAPKEDWEVKPLGTIAHFYNGKAHEQFIDANGNYKVVNSKFVSTGGKVFKSANVNICPLKKGDITMVMSDIPKGKALAKCFLVPKDDKYALNQRICAIRTEDVDTEFLYFILNRNKYYLAFDSGTGQTNLKKSDVLDCPIPLPKTKQEQVDIATILLDMNKEIEQLEQKLSKYKQLKQGLMQNLLTGKIRLV